MRHIPEKAEIDNGKLTKRKEPLIQGKYPSFPHRTMGFKTPGSHTARPPGVWCGRHCDRKQTWTISQEEGGGLGGSGPCLAALPACDVGSALGKLLLLSSHHTWSILIRPDCTFPSSRPQPQGTVQIVRTYAHVCTCATIDCNSKDKRLIPIMNIIAPCICKQQP